MAEKIWYRELGYYNNPFSLKPAAFTDAIFGYESMVNDIVTNIHASGLIFIEGNYGEGKTTILKRLINEFGGHGKVIYFSCNRIEQRLNVKKLLNDRYGFLGSLMDLQPKNMILLLDEAQVLDDKDYEKLMRYYESGNFLSVVFVGKQYDPTALPERLRRLIKVIRLEKLSNEEAVKLVRKRIGAMALLQDEVISYIFDVSDKNPRTMLKNCEEVCKTAFERGESKVTKEMVDKFLNNKEETAKEEPADEKLFVQKEEAEKFEDPLDFEAEEEEEVHIEAENTAEFDEDLNKNAKPAEVKVEQKTSPSDTDYY